MTDNDDIQSIYKTPQAPIEYLEDDEDNSDFVIAGKWKRFFNYLIDYVVMIVISIFLLTVAGLLLDEKTIEPIYTIPDFIFGTIMLILYYLPFELLTARTPGKLITGTKVVNEQGLKPSAGQMIGRTFARIVPFEPFSFLGHFGRGWHDTWTNTYVIDCREA